MKWVTAIMVAMSVPISPVTVPAMAQHAEPTCPADAAPLPAELSGWASRSGLAAAADFGSIGVRDVDDRQGGRPLAVADT